LLAFIEILRPLNGLMAAAGVLIGAALVGTALAPQLCAAAIVTFLVSSAGMTLNDYFDFKIDRINRPKRPLPSRRMSMRSALMLAYALYGVSIIIAFIMLPPLLSSFTIFNVTVTAWYAWKLKTTGAGHFAVAWLTASTFLYGAMLMQVTFTVWAVFGMAFATTLAREIAKAIEDFRGDSSARARTLVALLGRDIAILLALASVLVGISLSPIPYIVGGLNAAYVLLIIPADAAMVWAGWKLFRDAGHSQKLLKAAMALALGAFALGILF